MKKIDKIIKHLINEVMDIRKKKQEEKKFFKKMRIPKEFRRKEKVITPIIRDFNTVYKRKTKTALSNGQKADIERILINIVDNLFQIQSLTEPRKITRLKAEILPMLKYFRQLGFAETFINTQYRKLEKEVEEEEYKKLAKEMKDGTAKAKQLMQKNNILKPKKTETTKGEVERSFSAEEKKILKKIMKNKGRILGKGIITRSIKGKE